MRFCEPLFFVLSDFFCNLDIFIGTKKEAQKINSMPHTKHRLVNLMDHGTTNFHCYLAVICSNLYCVIVNDLVLCSDLVIVTFYTHF